MLCGLLSKLPKSYVLDWAGELLEISKDTKTDPARFSDFTAWITREGWAIHVHTGTITRSWVHPGSRTKREALSLQLPLVTGPIVHVYEDTNSERSRRWHTYRIVYRSPDKGERTCTPFTRCDTLLICQLGYHHWGKLRVAEWSMTAEGVIPIAESRDSHQSSGRKSSKWLRRFRMKPEAVMTEKSPLDTPWGKSCTSSHPRIEKVTPEEIWDHPVGIVQNQFFDSEPKTWLDVESKMLDEVRQLHLNS